MTIIKMTYLAIGIQHVCMLVGVTVAFQPNLIRSGFKIATISDHKFTTINRSTRSSAVCTESSHTSRNIALQMALDASEEDDDDDDDDEYLELEEDWRSFRSTLVNSGLSSETEGYIDEEGSGKSAETADKQKGLERPKSVSKANEELLKSQNPNLAKEYVDGVWSYPIPTAEAGGLVVRLPLEVEIYRNKDKLQIGKELDERLESNDSPNSDFSSFVSGSEENDRNELDLSFSPSSAQLILWYKKTQKLIEDEIATIANLADESGQINPRELEPKAEKLLSMYLDNQMAWQEVCLVVKNDESSKKATTIVINRPMAFRLSENLGKLLLYGAYIGDRKIKISEQNEWSKFLRAFEESCAVYVGGPDKMEDPAVLIHGIADLPGASELSPGTGIYQGGLPAAVQGILHGKYKPLDFRFFVGCHEYEDGQLNAAVYTNKYQPIACARTLALKQCIQLPKPLWHEVMELSGGELRDMSRLELMKRGDIQE